MASELTLKTIYTPSDDVVAREIEGDMIIVPVVNGIGDAEDELYTLNSTGKAIWEKLDGQRTLQDVARALAEKFDTTLPKIEKDVLGFVSELTRRNILLALDG